MHENFHVPGLQWNIWQGTWKFPCTSQANIWQGTCKLPCTVHGNLHVCPVCNETYGKEHGNFHAPRKQTFGKVHANFHVPYMEICMFARFAMKHMARNMEMSMYLVSKHIAMQWNIWQGTNAFQTKMGFSKITILRCQKGDIPRNLYYVHCKSYISNNN